LREDQKKKYKIKCDVCPHSFIIAGNKISSGRWCSYCGSKKYKWCKNKTYLPFDFSIEELKIIIEIDGEQHFIQVSNWKSPELALEKDIFKMKKALEKGYTIIRIIQIDIWNDKNNWREKLDELLIRHENPSVYYIGCDKKYKCYKDKFLL
jgi:very-short-patch-repair endonuclease